MAGRAANTARSTIKQALRCRNREENTMEQMIMIPAWRYEKMMEAYDKAVEELQQLREQLRILGEVAADEHKA